jgi:hypothetical protein
MNKHLTNFFSWAVSTVMTRQNLVPSPDGSRMIHALIPMWDMCNHENGRVSYIRIMSPVIRVMIPRVDDIDAFSSIAVDHDGLQLDIGSLRMLRIERLQERGANIHKLRPENKFRLLRALGLCLYG